MNEEVIKKICRYLIENRNGIINLSVLANEFNYNINYMVRAFKEHTGFKITEFVNECRVFDTIDPLVFTDDTMLKIALTHGFNSQEYYSEKFKECLDISPLKFRQVFSILADEASNTEDIEKLKSIRDNFSELKAYQDYLNSFAFELVSEEERKQKPKVKVLEPTVM